MEFVNGKDDIPYMKMENKKCFESTNQTGCLPVPRFPKLVSKSKRMTGKHQIYYSPMAKYM